MFSSGQMNMLISLKITDHSQGFHVSPARCSAEKIQDGYHLDL